MRFEFNCFCGAYGWYIEVWCDYHIEDQLNFRGYLWDNGHIGARTVRVRKNIVTGTPGWFKTEEECDKVIEMWKDCEYKTAWTIPIDENCYECLLMY